MMHHLHLHVIELTVNYYVDVPVIFPFGEGDGPILVHNLTCLGSESRLADCPLQLHDFGVCQHSQDAGVICGEVVGEL